MTTRPPTTPTTEASIRAEMDHTPPIDTSHLRTALGSHWTEPTHTTTSHGPALLWGSLDGRHTRLQPIQPSANHAPSAWWVWEVIPGDHRTFRRDDVVSSAEAARVIRKHLKAMAENGTTPKYFTVDLENIR